MKLNTFFLRWIKYSSHSGGDVCVSMWMSMNLCSSTILTKIFQQSCSIPARSVCLVFVRQWIYQTKFTETNFSLCFKLWLRSRLSFPPRLHRGVFQWILSMNIGEETILQNWRFWLKFRMQNPEKWELDLQRTECSAAHDGQSQS